MGQPKCLRIDVWDIHEHLQCFVGSRNVYVDPGSFVASGTSSTVPRGITGPPRSEWSISGIGISLRVPIMKHRRLCEFTVSMSPFLALS